MIKLLSFVKIIQFEEITAVLSRLMIIGKRMDDTGGFPNPKLDKCSAATEPGSYV